MAFSLDELKLLDRALGAFLEAPFWVSGCEETEEAAMQKLRNKLRKGTAKKV